MAHRGVSYLGTLLKSCDTRPSRLTGQPLWWVSNCRKISSIVVRRLPIPALIKLVRPLPTKLSRLSQSVADFLVGITGQDRHTHHWPSVWFIGSTGENSPQHFFKFQNFAKFFVPSSLQIWARRESQQRITHQNHGSTFYTVNSITISR